MPVSFGVRGYTIHPLACNFNYNHEIADRKNAHTGTKPYAHKPVERSKFSRPRSPCCSHQCHLHSADLMLSFVRTMREISEA